MADKANHAADIIGKWYKRIGFPEHYDEEFFQCLEETDLSDLTVYSSYETSENTPQKNLLACLFFCEDLEEQYAKKGISQDILIATLNDLVIWNDSYYLINGVIGVDEFPWLNRMYEMTIFRLGRLQFSMFPSGSEIEEIGIHKGEPVLEVHIPRGGPLLYEKCKASFDWAKRFFAEYYPDFPQTWYICHSWLLDEKILPLLGDNSNIARFQTFFKLLDKSESDYILRFCFRWDATRENIADFKPTSLFAEKIKQSVLAGEKFYEVLGIHR